MSDRHAAPRSLAPPTLPDFPWDSLADAAATARAHPDGLVDLSVGTPVDPTPDVVRAALESASNAPGYPQTHGTPAVRAAAAGWLRRRLGVDVAAEAVLPTVGSKELVALLPTLLGARGRVLFPALAYPTYDVGARIAGCEPVRVPMHADGSLDLDAIDPTNAALLWLNHPANPHGAMASVDAVRSVVEWGRRHDVLVVSDECYAEYGWEAAHVSALLDGPEGVLSVHSLSKRSNAAGMRAGFVAGDPAVVARLLEVRKHAGLIVPAPVQAAMVAALDDDDHVEAQRGRYAARRALMRPALERAGFTVDHSEGGLYLWARHADGTGCRALVERLARLGILVAPGEFYGPDGAGHVRVALTATDERIATAAARLDAAGQGANRDDTNTDDRGAA